MCEKGGQLVTMVGECLSPRCVDPVRGPEDCCRTCPNGEHSRSWVGVGGVGGGGDEGGFRRNPLFFFNPQHYYGCTNAI